jgi:intergrase/recombinase
LETGGKTNSAMEKYSKAVLCLFVPFWDEKQFNKSDQERSYIQQLRESKSTGALLAKSVAWSQNIQDCHNMMKVGRPDDVLEWITNALPDPIGSQHFDQIMTQKHRWI